MKEFKTRFLATEFQPQLFTMILTVIILITFAVVVYHKLKKSEVNKAPKGIVQVAELYVMGIDDMFKTTTEGKFTKPAPYIFTLISFLLVGNIMGLIGMDGPASSYSVTLTLGLVSWIGIYVVGIMYQKMRFFKKFLNPLELIGQFSPLISISFRLFGNMLAGSIILYLMYHFTGWLWGFIPVVGEMNLLASIITPFLHVYFDLFDGLVQAYVFALLTMIYWTLEAEGEMPGEKTKETQKAELIEIQNIKKEKEAQAKTLKA